MPVSCYGQRRLHPFRGVMNIISIGGADAVTIDGANWTRYLHHTFDYPADDPQRFLKLKCPMFALTTGAKRTASGMPLIASYHYNEIQAIGHVLLDAVKQHCDQSLSHLTIMTNSGAGFFTRRTTRDTRTSRISRKDAFTVP